MAKFDIPGACIHDETNDGVIMLLEGALSEFMVKATPKIYQKYVIIISKVKLLLYVHIKMELYSLLRSEILLYMKLIK